MITLNWAILGTGTIANEMAASMQKHGRPAYAVGNRTYEKAKAFGQKYGIQKVYADFQEMFIDPEVDVIYIATPHYMHFEFIDFITGVKGYELIFMVAGLMIMCFGMFLYWIQDTGAITLYMFSERCIDYCLQRYM